MNWKMGAAVLMLAACAACNRSAAKDTTAAPAIEPVADITIVGCVKPSDASAAGPSGAADTRYMLTDAKTTRNGSAVGTSGSTATPASTTYRLDDSRDGTIAPEVGHQVEIVAAVPAAEPGAKAPKLKVETIKMVAVPCP
jgi:hypothetical protein